MTSSHPTLKLKFESIRAAAVSLLRFFLTAALILGSASPSFSWKKVVVPGGLVRGTSPLSPAIQTDDLTYVSGMVGRDADGRYRAGDIRGQTRQTLENIGLTLQAAGLSFQHVVSVNLYLADIRHLEAFDEVYREFFPKSPPARTTLEAQLMDPNAIVEISAIAGHDMERRRTIHPLGWPNPSGPFSYAVAVGDTLFLSALKPVDPKTGERVFDSIEDHTEQALRNQEAILKAAGMEFADLVFSRIHLAHPSFYQGLNEAYRKFVVATPPARATVIGRTDDPRHLVQIQSAAVKGSGEGRPSGEGFTSPIHSYSVKAKNRLYITGMTGRRPDGTIERGDIRAQTRQALATIEEQLTRHGMTFADVVESTVWMRDARDFAGMNEAYAEIVRPNPPARATVRISPTSGEALVEIMMTAVK